MSTNNVDLIQIFGKGDNLENIMSTDTVDSVYIWFRLEQAMSTFVVDNLYIVRDNRFKNKQMSTIL